MYRRGRHIIRRRVRSLPSRSVGARKSGLAQLIDELEQAPASAGAEREPVDELERWLRAPTRLVTRVTCTDVDRLDSRRLDGVAKNVAIEHGPSAVTPNLLSVVVRDDMASVPGVQTKAEAHRSVVEIHDPSAGNALQLWVGEHLGPESLVGCARESWLPALLVLPRSLFDGDEVTQRIRPGRAEAALPAHDLERTLALQLALVVLRLGPQVLAQMLLELLPVVRQVDFVRLAQRLGAHMPSHGLERDVEPRHACVRFRHGPQANRDRGAGVGECSSHRQ